MTKYKQHPLSAAFPAMSNDEYTSLVDSVTNVGVLNPITIFDGMVLDGWNRYRAAAEVGYECPKVDLGEVDPREFVMAQNGARRNLTASQRALAAATCYQWKPVGNPQFRSTSELATQTTIAASVKVSDTTLRQAKQVVDHAVEEVKEAVRSGETSVETAAGISKLPKHQQAEALITAKPVRHRGKPKKGPKADLIRAELKAAGANDRVSELEALVIDLQQQLNDTVLHAKTLEGENESIAKILDASDQLEAALAEAKKYRELASGLQARVNSMTTQIAELKRSVSAWKKKAGVAA